MDGPWKRDPQLLFKHRPKGVGILHFNGGSESKDAYYESARPRHYKTDPLWNLAKYYVDLPWNWALFQLSQSNQDQATHPGVNNGARTSHELELLHKQALSS